VRPHFGFCDGPVGFETERLQCVNFEILPSFLPPFFTNKQLDLKNLHGKYANNLFLLLLRQSGQPQLGGDVQKVVKQRQSFPLRLIARSQRLGNGSVDEPVQNVAVEHLAQVGVDERLVGRVGVVLLHQRVEKVERPPLVLVLQATGGEEQVPKRVGHP